MVAGLALRLPAGAHRGVGDGARCAAPVLDPSGVLSGVAAVPRSDFDSCSAATALRRRRRRRRRAMVAGLALGLSAGAQRVVGVGTRCAAPVPDSSGVLSGFAAVPRSDRDSCSVVAAFRCRRRRWRRGGGGDPAQVVAVSCPEIGISKSFVWGFPCFPFATAGRASARPPPFFSLFITWAMSSWGAWITQTRPSPSPRSDAQRPRGGGPCGAWASWLRTRGGAK